MLDACTRIFDRIYDIWNKHGWLVLVIFAFIIFGIYWFWFRKDKKSGTYSDNYFYDSTIQNQPKQNIQHYNNQPSYI